MDINTRDREKLANNALRHPISWSRTADTIEEVHLSTQEDDVTIPSDDEVSSSLRVQTPQMETLQTIKIPGLLYPFSKRGMNGILKGHNAPFEALDFVQIPGLLHPKSSYHPWSPPLPRSDEKEALGSFVDGSKGGEGDTEDDGDFECLQLHDFVIYRSETAERFPGQMVTLDEVASNLRSGQFRYRINGTLENAGVLKYIENVQIKDFSIEGFEVDEEEKKIHSVQDLILVQTKSGQGKRRRREDSGVWYRLTTPAKEYEKYYNDSLWVSNLSKHVIDYFATKHGNVRLADFREDFHRNIIKWHADDANFQTWHHQFRDRVDFRTAIVRHRNFLFDQAYGVDRAFHGLCLWDDMPIRTDALCTIPEQPRLVPERHTVVTPYVRRCFKNMPWKGFLRAYEPDDAIHKARVHSMRKLGIYANALIPHESEQFDPKQSASWILENVGIANPYSNYDAESVLGKFVIVRRNQLKPNDPGFKFSYAFVTDVYRHKRSQYIKVIWVRQFSDTTYGSAFYHCPDELFMSDKCNCNSENGLRLSDVVVVVDVTTFSGEPKLDALLFMRSKYIKSERCFLSLQQSDFRCSCRQTKAPKRQNPKEISADTYIPPTVAAPTLRGLGLFSGCGNFDRGLEECGAVEFVAAVEFDTFAAHSYAANRERGAEGLFFGSINDFLFRVMQGEIQLPRVGSIDLISAGSPCPGFSKMNNDPDSEASYLKCSLLASALANIETYMPKYAILENVANMGDGQNNAGDQTVALLLGLGYQVRKLLLNSANFGSAQYRRRLFIVAAAPSLPLPSLPILSHYSAGEDEKHHLSRIESDGVVSNAPQPIARAMSLDIGLSETSNDKTVNVSDPDHVCGQRQTPSFRRLLKDIPKAPKKMNFIKSITAGWQRREARDWLETRADSYLRSEGSYAYQRLDPDGLIPTIMTQLTPSCARGGGQIIHWHEDRTLTLLEIRRAQGIPDEEPLIGPLLSQWKQVGNAVARPVASAIGVTIKDSWHSGHLNIAALEADVVRPIKAESIKLSDSESGPGEGNEDEDVVFIRQTMHNAVPEPEASPYNERFTIIENHKRSKTHQVMNGGFVTESRETVKKTRRIESRQLEAFSRVTPGQDLPKTANQIPRPARGGTGKRKDRGRDGSEDEMAVFPWA